MAYIGKSPTGAGVRSRFHFTATGGETSLSGADDNGKTLVFADGEYVDVYLNGVLLFDGDYNTTTANTIGGLSALTASDVVEIVVYDIFSVADTVSAKNGGTFNGDVTVNADFTVDTDTLYVDSAGNRVGIGTTDPSSNTSTYYDDLVIKNDTSGSGAGITIQANTTNGFGAVDFRKADGTQIGKVYASSAGNQLAFETGGTERMRIHSSGVITKNNHPAFYANKTLTFDTNNTDIVFDTVRTNVGSHYNNSNGKFTAPVDGTYFFSYGTLLNTTSTNAYGYLRLAFNGSGSNAYIMHSSYNSSRNYEPLSWSGVVDLDAGDVVTVKGHFQNSNTYGGGSYTFFSGHLLG